MNLFQQSNISICDIGMDDIGKNVTITGTSYSFSNGYEYRITDKNCIIYAQNSHDIMNTSDFISGTKYIFQGIIKTADDPNNNSFDEGYYIEVSMIVQL